MAQYMKEKHNRGLRPAIQGDLDALCGIYSVVNALYWLHPGLRRKPLFRALVSFFSQHYDIADCLITGTESAQLDALLNFLQSRRESRWPFHFHKPFARTRGLTTRDILAQCRNWLAQHPDRVVLLGDQYHWSVVSHMDSKWMYFFDSGSYTRVRQRYWSLRARPGGHQLFRQAIWFIEKGEADDEGA